MRACMCVNVCAIVLKCVCVSFVNVHAYVRASVCSMHMVCASEWECVRCAYTSHRALEGA